MTRFQKLEDAVSQWALDRPDVRAVLVVGSRAQSGNLVDQYSDLDLIIYTTHPVLYDADTSWLTNLGEIWLAYRSRTDPGDREWLVLFAGAIKADFVIAHALRDKGLAELLEESVYIDVYRRGVRVLYDKSGASGNGELLLAPQIKNVPTPDEFELGVNRLILAVARAAKFIHRRDMWHGQQQSNVEVKKALLVLIEWHAGLRRSADNDAWYAGQHIEQWADPRVVTALPDLFAGYDEVELRGALTSTIDLFEWLAQETASSLEMTFPNSGQSEALAWVREILA